MGNYIVRQAVPAGYRGVAPNRGFHRAPLLTRGVVDIFRQDWPLDSSAAVRDLDLRMTPLADGLERALAALP